MIMMIWTVLQRVCRTWVSSFKHYAGKKSNRRRIWNLNTNLYYWKKPSMVWIKPDGTYVDGTLGGAGHAQEVCRRLSAKGRFIGIDQDQDAIVAASERLSAYGDRVQIIRRNYCYMANELKNLGIQKVDGIVLDLGVSSYQLDNEERGFTYRVDAPLDMRMDQRQSRTAGIS